MQSNSNKFISLDRAYRLDEAINTEENHLVIVRFGESDEACKQVDEWLASETDSLKVGAKIYAVAMNSVPELVARYNLSGPSTILFFANKNLVQYLSGDKINPGKIKETVGNAVAVMGVPTPPAPTTGPDVNHTGRVDSPRTPSAPPGTPYSWFSKIMAILNKSNQINKKTQQLNTLNP